MDPLHFNMDYKQIALKMCEQIQQKLPQNYDAEHQQLLKNPVLINSWQEYAHESSYGRVEFHFRRLSAIDNCPIESASECIHQTFNNISDCIAQLLKTLNGNALHFRLFKENCLCYDCLLSFCSNQAEIEQLFERWYNGFMQERIVFRKELFYFANCLLKYRFHRKNKRKQFANRR